MHKLLSKLSFVDVETTGTSATGDRIIDIGIVRVEDGKIVEEFESLVNPMTHLSPFISKMTSITPEMLYKAPSFIEIKSKVYELLDGTTFVAHNAQFDYAFIKQEFARYETKFNAKMLCTVRLSRMLFPGFHHHNLDAVIERFQIPVEHRHRAMPDAKALYYFLEKAKNIVPEERFYEVIRQLSKRTKLPHLISPEIVRSIPNLPGVYIFYDKDGNVLYVGKSTHLKDRIMSHFSSFHSNSTDLKLAGFAADIEIRRTGGDLSASLLEAELVKKLQPIYNKMLRSVREMVAIVKDDSGEYHSLKITKMKVPIKEGYDKVLALFPSIKKAKEALNELCKEKHICPIKSGLEKGKGPCFYYQIGKCDGACIGHESALKHNIKLIEAFGTGYIPKWPFNGSITIKEESEDLTQLIHISNWMHTGTSTLGQQTLNSESKEVGIYSDTVKILKRFLGKREYQKKIVKV